MAVAAAVAAVDDADAVDGALDAGDDDGVDAVVGGRCVGCGCGAGLAKEVGGPQ